MKKYKEFLTGATERALKTAGQFGAVALGGNAFNAWTIDVRELSGIMLSGLLISYLTSLASAPFGDKGTPSLVKEEQHG